jgi:hypothetical protein
LLDRPWKDVDDVEIGTAEWVDWLDHRRLYTEDPQPARVGLDQPADQGTGP